MAFRDLLPGSSTVLHVEQAPRAQAPKRPAKPSPPPRVDPQRRLREAVAAMTPREWDMAVALIKANVMRDLRRQGPKVESWEGIQQRQIGVRLRWTPKDRERILSSCESGDFYPLALFLDSMRANGPVYGAMRARGALLRLPIQWSGDPWLIEWLRGSEPTFDPRTGALLSPGHRSDFQKIFPLAELGAVLWDGDLAGLGLGEFVPDKRGYKRLRHLDLHWVFYDWGTRQLEYRSPWETYVIRPGDGRWFVYAPYGLERWWSRAPWFPCALPVIAMEGAILDRGRWQQDHADPLKVIKIHRDRWEQDHVDMETFARDDWHRSAHLVLRDDELAELVEGNGRGYEVYTEAEKSAADLINVTLRGQTATSGDAGGGLANTGSVWENVEANIIAESAEHLAETVQEQGLTPYALAKGRAPLVWLKWDCRTPQQKIADAEAMKTHAEGLKAMNEAAKPYGKRVDLDAQIESAGLTLELEDIEQPAVPPALPGAPQPPRIVAHALASDGIDVAEVRLVHGLPIVVDRPAGTIQRGVGPDGPWAREYLVDYGYVEGTTAPDGEGIDVYLGPQIEAPTAWIVEQLRQDGSPDELKILLDFATREVAIGVYLLHVPSWCLGPVREVPAADLAAILRGAMAPPEPANDVAA